MSLRRSIDSTRATSTKKKSPLSSLVKRIFSSEAKMAEEEVDFSQLPLLDRFQHKNWKVRKEGYEAAVKAFEITPDESDPVFRPFNSDSGLWKGAAGDSNVAAQQEGLAALCAFLKYGGVQGAQRSRSHTIQPIYEKGLTSTRPVAKANAYEAVLLYIEVDKPDAVIEEILPALTHKQPKVIAATLNALTQIYHNFGIKVVDPKAVLKVLPKIYGHADKNVRAEGQNLTVELYRWLKEAMKPLFWSELKPVQQTDLEKLFEKVKEEPTPKQERFTRAQQAQMAAQQEKAATAGPEDEDEPQETAEAEEEPAEVDVFDLAEPVDAASKIPASFNDNINSSKWKERKDALDELFNILNTPRLKEGQYDDVVRALAKSMKDANIAVVTVAANCVEKLASGLRKGFSRYRSNIMAPMMERLKEKKQSVTDALGAAMDAVFNATSFSDNLSEIMAMLVHKNPNVKGETIKFLVRCLRSTRDVPAKDEQKQIAEAGTKLLTESTEQMRSGGAEILGTMMKIIGERAMGPYLDGLDDIRKTKIKEYFDTAEVKAKERPKPIVGPPKPAAAKKMVGGKKAPVKKAAPPPAEDPTPLQPKPTARAPPKTSAPTKPGLAASKLGGLKKPAASSMASPQRRVISDLSNADDEESAAPSPSKFGAGRGGLTSRSLAKPSAMPASPPPVPRDNGLGAAERAELEDLRLEKERMLSLTETLRAQNMKLSNEISELQNQNAQLIEDHTRDVLQIKAKETQLVRARGECDVLRAEIESTRKDSERYKREVSRLGRESIGREREDMMRGRQQYDEPSDNAYEESPARYSMHLNGNSRPGSTLQRTGSTTSNGSSRAPTARPPSNLSAFSPTEEKENAGSDGLAQAAMRRKISPPMGTSSAGRSPQRPQFGMSREQSSTSVNSGSGEGENWKRAAEVTSQLKARIEAMKARQGLTKPSY
ncbi:hypothetical protein PMZ80_003492 [Knufia obscura]|uniref:TOG domain-containing protein n=1 Tax=Knufia obscura TaxID=1635080 RepID=A0ABR0RUC5_9EURO|nr:hypothetical protein PMZ80_003492 [Knufia obscura]